MNYEIIKEIGLGTVDSPVVKIPTGISVETENAARTVARILWEKDVPKDYRESGCCGIFYTFKPIKT